MKTVAYYQQLVDQTIQALGGYWRPLSGLARLLEELGELNELLLQESESEAWQDKLAGELTDLFIISTCLAHQYCGDLEEEYHKLGQPTDPEELYRVIGAFSTPVEGLLHITARSGQIGRILNHYDGDKKKKPSEQHRSIANEVAILHTYLIRFANTVQVRLFDHIEKTLSFNLARDKNRFSLTYDPITESSRMNFINALKLAGKLTTEKLWGALPWDVSKTIEENAANSSLTVERWLKCGKAEQIEGIVFEAPTLAGEAEQPEQISERIKEALSRLVEFDGNNISIEIYRPEALQEPGAPKKGNESDSLFYYLTRSII